VAHTLSCASEPQDSMFALLLKLRLLTAWRQPATASSLLVSDVTFGAHFACRQKRQNLTAFPSLLPALRGTGLGRQRPELAGERSTAERSSPRAQHH